MLNNIYEMLRENTYPGRGILIGQSADSSRAIIAYFIMGRSENSRNRVFEATDDGFRTKAHDPAKLTDPSLVIYNPVRRVGTSTIITNGDQTDTIRDFFVSGGRFRDALMTREFEPDGPNFTPRISGVVYKGGIYSLSILKSADGNPDCCCRYFFDYSSPIPGTGHFISTYQGDGNPLPSFAGEPVAVTIDCGYRELADKLWSAMDADNKVSLYTCEIDIQSGAFEYVIINKHEEACI